MNIGVATPDSHYYQWWNGELQRWIDENEYIIEYNANGEVSKEEMYSEGFDVDSLRFIKRGDFKHEYFFDSNNNEIGNIYLAETLYNRIQVKI